MKGTSYVYSGAAAAALGVSQSWVRSMIRQRICDETRPEQGKGNRYLFHIAELQQLLVAKRLRELRVGLDTIRQVVDALYFDGDDVATASFNEVFITVDQKKIARRARAALKVAHSLQYGEPYRETVPASVAAQFAS
jgi:DNA-binding transcriptional MerR regulator